MKPPRASQPAATALEAALGHSFHRADLLRLALTHRSAVYEARGIDERTAPRHAIENGVDNEQLEFLGDAVLGLLIAEGLLARFPHASEGQMTQMRAALVSRKRLGALGAALALGDHIHFGKSAERVGGRSRPALLANAVEAVLGALYLDGGLEPARRLIDRVLLDADRDTLEAALAEPGRGALLDAKTQLQERVQAAGRGRLQYIDAGESGPAHQRRFRVEAQLLGHRDGVTQAASAAPQVLGSGEGTTKKEAQQRAAQQALDAWAPDPPSGAAHTSQSAATPGRPRP